MRSAWLRLIKQARLLATRSPTGSHAFHLQELPGLRQSPAAATSWSSWATYAAGLGLCTSLALSTAAAKDNELDPETLKELQHDLLHFGHHADRERAVAMLSGLTLYLENHGDLLKAGILPALMTTVQDEQTVPQIRNVALGSTADLMKNAEAHTAVTKDSAFLACVVAALQSQGTWADGPEDGGIARSHAARLLAELAGQPELHAFLIRQHAAGAIAESAAVLGQESEAGKQSYKSISAVPANMFDIQEKEEERFIGAALFGLAGSSQGADVITGSCEGGALRALVFWARGRDPILRRYAVGSLARSLTSSAANYGKVKSTGGLMALAGSLTVEDGQTQCYAAAAIGRVAANGGQICRDLITASAPASLTSMLRAASTGKGQPSGKVQEGVQRCALRAIMALSQQRDMHEALTEAGIPDLLQVLLKDEGFCQNSDLASAALGTMQQLGKTHKAPSR